jgi:hypothetical protein
VTIITAGYGNQLEDIAEELLDQQLSTAHAAYSSGQRQGLIEAVNLLNAHNPDQPWPEWVRAGVQLDFPELLDRFLLPRRKKKGGRPTKRAARNRGGRLANEKLQRRQRTIDFARTEYINRLLNEGLTPSAAYKRASQELRIEVDGQPIASSERNLSMSDDHTPPEQRRQQAEGVRQKAEDFRRLAEEARELRDQQREALETIRQERERLRQAGETARIAAEDARGAAEDARHATIEAVHATAETLQATLEQMKVVEDMRRTLRDIRGATQPKRN